MDNKASLFNKIPPLLGAETCQPIFGVNNLSKESLNLGISIYAPVSSVPGSASFFFLQPLLTGKVFASIGVLIAAQLFLFLADRLWGLESRPVQKKVLSSEQTVQMSLSDLQDFLNSLAGGVQSPVSPRPGSQDVTGTISEETREIPLVLALTVWSEYTIQPYCPTVFLILPVLTFPGARGSLPLLILELLTTIFVRSVVPPQTTGSKPLTDPAAKNNKLLQFSPEDLLNLLNRFSKHFGT